MVDCLCLARRGASAISQDRQCKGAADECFLHRVFVIIARLHSALGSAHPQYILLIHSMLRGSRATLDLAVPSLRKTRAGRIKHPDDATEPGTLDPPSPIPPLFRA